MQRSLFDIRIAKLRSWLLSQLCPQTEWLKSKWATMYGMCFFSYVSTNLRWLVNSLTPYHYDSFFVLYLHFDWPLPLNLTGQDGTTPLMLAACLGHDSIVMQLLKKQADTDIQNQVRAVNCAPCVVECLANDACEEKKTRGEGWIESEASQQGLLECTDYLLIHRWGGRGRGRARGCLFLYSLALCLLFLSSNFKTNLHNLSENFTIFEWHVDSRDISSITVGWLYSTYVSYTVWSCQYCEANSEY